MARSDFLFTSESVSEGHPDKVADRISDEIVDLYYREGEKAGIDPYQIRVAAETLVTTNRVVIAGEANSVKAKELLCAAHSVFQPNKIILGNAGAVEAFAGGLPAKGGALAYLCAGNACRPPTGDAANLKEMLESSG